MINTFTLGAREYRVEYVDHDNENLGTTYAPLDKVEIQKVWRGKELSEVSIDQTLTHEVIHCILNDLGYYEQSKDETFVQSFSLLMHQYINTRK